MNKTALFQSGTDGYRAYRIPALAVSTRGTILAFCEARKNTGRDDDQIDILLRRSFDNGITWETRQQIVGDGDRTCGNPCPVVERDTGAIWLPFCKDNQQIFVTRSDDDGSSWSAPLEITRDVSDPAWSYLGTGPGHGIQLADGRLLIPCWTDESPGPVTWRTPAPNWGKTQSSYAFFSDDRGATWQRGAKMTTDASDECLAVETADGAVYMNMRSRQNRHCRAYSWSRDRGETWSAVEFDPTLPEPSCQGGIVRFSTRDRAAKNRVLLSHPAHPQERAELTVRLSYDECRTWPVARVLHDGSGAYSDLAVTADDQILCLYEADAYSRLVLARFDLEWLTQGQDSL